MKKKTKALAVKEPILPDYKTADAISQLTHPKKRVFLECLYATMNISKAAKAALISRRTVYDWIKNDPQFKEIYDNQMVELLDAGKEKLLNAALSKKTGQGTTELIFFLKSMHPEFKPQKETIALKQDNLQFVVTRG